MKFILAIFLIFPLLANHDIVENQMCHHRTSCDCVPTHKGKKLKIRCKFGFKCKKRSIDGKFEAYCKDVSFAEYKCEETHCSIGLKQFCWKGEYPRLSQKYFCGKNPLNTYKPIYPITKCTVREGCLCKLVEKDESKHFLVQFNQHCQEFFDPPYIERCEANACYCAHKNGECSRGQYCIGGKFNGCTYTPNLQVTQIAENYQCKNRNGCLCGQDILRPNVLTVMTSNFQKDNGFILIPNLSYDVDNVYCGYQDICQKTTENISGRMKYVYKCAIPMKEMDRPCDQNYCYQTTETECKLGQFYRPEADRCASKGLKALVDSSECQTPEGCVCRFQNLQFNVPKGYPCSFGLQKSVPKVISVTKCEAQYCMCGNDEACGLDEFCVVQKFVANCYKPQKFVRYIKTGMFGF